jgi:hypothetical protein
MKETEGLRKELEKMKPLLGPDALMHEAFCQMTILLEAMTDLIEDLIVGCEDADG